MFYYSYRLMVGEGHVLFLRDVLLAGFFTIWFCGFSPVFVALLLLAALVFRHTSDTPGSTSNTQNLRQQPSDARGVKRQMLAGAIQ